jgi:hypothetical protein
MQKEGKKLLVWRNESLRGKLIIDPLDSYTGCFKKSFVTLEAYVNVFRIEVQCFELS